MTTASRRAMYRRCVVPASTYWALVDVLDAVDKISRRYRRWENSRENQEANSRAYRVGTCER